MCVTFLVNYGDGLWSWWLSAQVRAASVDLASSPLQLSCYQSTVLLLVHAWMIRSGEVSSQSQIHPQTGRIPLASLESADVDVAGVAACSASCVYPRDGQPSTIHMWWISKKKKSMYLSPHQLPPQPPPHPSFLYVSRRRKSDRKKTHTLFVCSALCPCI